MNNIDYLCISTCYIATRSRYTPCGYKRYVQQIILELLNYRESTTNAQRTTAKVSEMLPEKPLKNHCKVPRKGLYTVVVICIYYYVFTHCSFACLLLHIHQ